MKFSIRDLLVITWLVALATIGGTLILKNRRLALETESLNAENQKTATLIDGRKYSRPFSQAVLDHRQEIDRIVQPGIEHIHWLQQKYSTIVPAEDAVILRSVPTLSVPNAKSLITRYRMSIPHSPPVYLKFGVFESPRYDGNDSPTDATPLLESKFEPGYPREMLLPPGIHDLECFRSEQNLHAVEYRILFDDRLLLSTSFPTSDKVNTGYAVISAIEPVTLSQSRPIRTLMTYNLRIPQSDKQGRMSEELIEFRIWLDETSSEYSPFPERTPAP